MDLVVFILQWFLFFKSQKVNGIVAALHKLGTQNLRICLTLRLGICDKLCVNNKEVTVRRLTDIESHSATLCFWTT